MKLLKPFAVCLLLAVLVAGAKGQPGCLISTIGEPVILLPPVLGAPFSADIVKEQLRPGTDETGQVFHGKLYRDSAGRARCEIEDATGNIRVIEIVDPVAKLYIRLLTRDKLARVTHQPANPPPTPASTPAVTRQIGFAPHEEDLGSRTIEGLVATGKRFTKTQEARDAEQAAGRVTSIEMSENWFSNDLQIKLLEVIDFGGAKVVHRALNVQPGNPDPGVFQIPEDYTVKNIYCRGSRCDYDSP